MGRPRSWTDDQLRSAVASESTWRDVVLAIGRADGGEARRSVQAHASRLGLDIGHLPLGRPANPVSPNDAGSNAGMPELAGVLLNVSSWAEALRCLDLTVSGAGYKRLQAAAREMGLDVSHFQG